MSRPFLKLAIYKPAGRYVEAIEQCTFDTEHSAKLAMKLIRRAYKIVLDNADVIDIGRIFHIHQENINEIWALYPRAYMPRMYDDVRFYRHVWVDWKDRHSRKRMSRKQRTRRLRQEQFMASLRAEAAYDARQYSGNLNPTDYQIMLETSDRHRNAVGGM